jgi:tRNA (cytidine/uridine-2'-O-)-methyltransferase
MPRLHVALVAPEIHWNTGNAGRTCLAAGAQLHLVEPLGFSLAEREVRRAGLDYWERVAVRRWQDWPAFEHALAGLGTPYFFSAEANLDYWDVDYPSPVTLVFGGESRGLPPDLRQRYRDRLVRLPMVDREVRSLNLSTAVGIALFEVLRQWRSKGLDEGIEKRSGDGSPVSAPPGLSTQP